MAIKYYCRHCGTAVGEIDNKLVNAEQLGFHSLSEQDRNEMIDYQVNGDIHVKTICEDCHEALNRNPQLHENNTFIH